MSNPIRMCVQKFSKEGRNNAMRDIKTTATFLKNKQWSIDDVLKVGFLSEGGVLSRSTNAGGKVDPLEDELVGKRAIPSIIRIIQERFVPYVGLNISFVEDPKDANIRIDFDPNGGSWAYVGKDHNNFKYPSPTVNFGWLDVPTIMHEFGHVLGMVHEHQNPRGGIKWNKQAVYEWARRTQGWDKSVTDQNILDAYTSDQTQGSDFDPLSIMLYFFPSELTLNGKGTKQNRRLSGLDVQYLANTYATNARETASEFYKDVYNETLDKAIEESSKPYSNPFLSIDLFIVFLVLIILIILIIKYLSNL